MPHDHPFGIAEVGAEVFGHVHRAVLAAGAAPLLSNPCTQDVLVEYLVDLVAVDGEHPVIQPGARGVEVRRRIVQQRHAFLDMEMRRFERK